MLPGRFKSPGGSLQTVFLNLSNCFLKHQYTHIAIVGGFSESSSVSIDALENIHLLALKNFGLIYRNKFNDNLFLHGPIYYKQHFVPLGYTSMKLYGLSIQTGIIYCFGH
jgi:hypothetical protein